MAELVGEAYIRITADTTLMKRALRAQMKQAGKDGGKAFSDEVEKASKGFADNAQRDFAKGFADPKQFDKMAKQFDSVEHAAKDFNDQLELYIKNGHVASGDTEVFRNALKNWEKQAIKTRDAAKELTKAHEEAIVENRRFTVEQKKSAADMKAILNRDHGEALRQVREAAAARKKASDEQYKMDLLHDQAIRLRADEAAKKDLADRLARFKDLQRMAAYTLKTDRAEAAAKQRAEALAERTRKAEERLAAARKKAGTDQVGLFKRIDRGLSGFNLGKYFGKGSRNDFINIIGGLIGGIGKLVTVPLALASRAVNAFVTTFSDGFNTAQAAGSGFFKSTIAGFGGIATAIGESLPAWPVLAAGAVLAFAAIGPIAAILPGLVSLVGLLATAVASLTSAISFGLVGALLAVAPAALGAIAGLGGVFAVIQSFVADKKNKKFMTDFAKPFEKFNQSHWPEVKTFLTNIKSGFGTLFADINPAVTAFFTSWKTAMNDPATKKGLGNFSDSIGRMATSLNTALPQALSGLIGFFQPILPYAEKLSTAIANAFKQFDKWANSKPGQNAIADFMKRAWEDANDVWNILTDIGSIIGTVFDFGESSGDDFLKGIHGWLQKIDTYLNDPANKGAIDSWFANAKQIGDDVGKIAAGVGDAIKALSSPEGQAGAKTFMDNLAKVAENARLISDAIVTIGKVSGLGVIMSALGYITGGNTKPVAPPETPQMKRDKTDLALTNYKISLSVDDKLYRQKIAAIEAYQLTGKTIPIEGNEALWEAVKDTAAAYIFDPKTVEVTGNQTQWDATKGIVTDYTFAPKDVPVGADPSKWNETEGAISGYTFTGKQVPVAGADGPWLATRNSVSDYVFHLKNVPVDGADGPWVSTRKEVSGFQFASKSVTVTADTSSANAALRSTAALLANLRSKNIRVGGVTSVGGKAAGGVFTSPTYGLFGEDGPEAIVPLDRPLSKVNPEVRSMSALLQGLTGGRGALNQSGPRVNFAEGAIQVNLPTGDPKLAAEAVLDRLVAFIG